MSEPDELQLAAKAGLEVLKRLLRHSDKRRSGGFYLDLEDVVRLEEIEAEARGVIERLEAATQLPEASRLPERPKLTEEMNPNTALKHW